MKDVWQPFRMTLGEFFLECVDFFNHQTIIAMSRCLGMGKRGGGASINGWAASCLYVRRISHVNVGSHL